MTFPLTNAWNSAYESEPSGSSSIAGGDDIIRNLKRDVRERLEIDHVIQDGVNSDGQHLKTTLVVQTVAPTAVASAGILHTLDVNDVAELFWVDEDGNSIQLTDGGEWGLGLEPHVFKKVPTVATRAVQTSGNLTPNPDAYGMEEITMAGNVSMLTPLNPRAGAVLNYMFLQNATGGWGITYSDAYLFPSGADKQPDPTASAISMLTMIYSASKSKWLCSMAHKYA